jgi:tetratricopeptide (TPR) repeat protein
MNAHFELADRAIRGESWAEAVEHLRLGLAQQPDALAYGRLASCLAKLGRDRESLAAADAGLRLEPGNGSLADLRGAIAAQHADDHPGAAELHEPARSDDGHTADEHTERGWEALLGRRPAEALEQFRAALLLDRAAEMARIGMVQALKARYPLYRLLLGGLELLQSLARFSLVVFLALIFLRRPLLRWAMANPDQAVWAYALIYCGWAFLVLTWIAEPLVNLVLRLNRYGRLALLPEQVAASNWVGVCLFLAVGCLTWALVGGGEVGWIGAAVCGLLMVPASALFRVRRGWPRGVLALYTSALASAGVGGIILLLLAQDAQGAKAADLRNGGWMCLLGFVVGLFLHGFLVDFLMLAGGRQREVSSARSASGPAAP